MKLARPDVFHPRLVLAGCPALPEGDGDDADLIPALRTHGLHARWLSWDDPETLKADLVILRATWDYVDRLDEFLIWTKRVRNLLNAPEVVAWNVDKRYLAALAEDGVPTVPGQFFEPGQRVRLPHSDEIVIKPAVGAGSVQALRFSDRTAARAHASRLQADGRAVLVQPYDSRVENGETALVFLNGRQSHAFTKAPILPPGGRPAFDPSGTYARETLTPAEPDFEVWDVGQAALTAAATRIGVDVGELLYARVDVLGDAADAQLLELELVEPSLGWRQLDPATRVRRQRDFVRGVEDALERFGLGPLSHRRP